MEWPAIMDFRRVIGGFEEEVDRLVGAQCFEVTTGMVGCVNYY